MVDGEYACDALAGVGEGKDDRCTALVATDGDKWHDALVGREVLIDVGNEERRDAPAAAGGEERCETLEDVL